MKTFISINEILIENSKTLFKYDVYLLFIYREKKLWIGPWVYVMDDDIIETVMP